ncbi:MAG: hypothetical protein IK015_07450 [Treponema sp.]|nr:hypothetical protein [Treponema sp.]
MYIYINFACAKLAASERSDGAAFSLRVLISCKAFARASGVVEAIKKAQREGRTGRTLDALSLPFCPKSFHVRTRSDSRESFFVLPSFPRSRGQIHLVE